MAVPFRKSAGAKRQERVRVVLGAEHFQKKNRFYVLGQFVAEHFKLIVLTLSVVACLFLHAYYYNRLTTMKQQAENLRAQIEAGLQMRQNIIPALTTAVNRYIGYEKGLFLSAVEARKSSFNGSKDVDKLSQSLKSISGSDFSPGELAKFMAVAENYPQLVSNQSYQRLIDQIADVENQIYKKRIEYNDAANRLNTYLNRFPVNACGRIMGFRLEPYFKWNNTAEWELSVGKQTSEPPMRMELQKSEPKK